MLRALREGVDKNGDALFPMMPYEDYRSLSDEDAKSIVVYLRTLAPVNHSVPAKKLDFPVNLFVKLVPGKEYSGGWLMKGPWGRNVTPNLTPHPDAYLGKATKAEFIGRFKSFESLTGENAPAAPKGRNTVMPWLPLSGLTEDDLGMLFDFLRTLPPIENKVNSFPDAPSPAS